MPTATKANRKHLPQKKQTAARRRGPTPEKIVQLTWGFAPPLLMHAAVSTGIFDSLDRSPKTPAEVAADARVAERGATAVLGGLLAAGLVEKLPGGRFRPTPDVSKFLVHAKPEFQGGLVEHMQADLIRSWLNLAEITRTGKPDNSLDRRNDNGAEFFERLVPALFPTNYPAAKALARALNYGESADGIATVKVLDIAAGSGVWGIAQAQASPRVRVTALDTEPVIAVTRRTVENHGVAGQFDYRPGDMRITEFGKGYQLVILGHILHSEGAERSRDLLRRSFEALAPGGTIAIAEFLVNAERTGPPSGLIFAVNMLVNTEEGTTFSFEEIRGWLRDIGFKKARTLDVPAPSPLILAERPT